MFHMLFGESDSDDEIVNLNAFRRNLRTGSDPLKLDDITFKKRFRLTKEAFKYVLETLDLPSGQRSTAITPAIQLAAVLELMAKGSYQDQVGNAQSTLSKVLWKVIGVMEEKLCPVWIKFTRKDETRSHFYNKYKIPGVLGCVDGTHVFLLRPSEDEHMFFNRKGKHSLNVMVVCDHKMRIMGVDSQYGGATHDSFVWGHSVERRFFEAEFLIGYIGYRNSWLLGMKKFYFHSTEIQKDFFTSDSGYPLEPWLLTPYRRAEESFNANFNHVHSQARSVVERCIGTLKGRWRILLQERQPRYTPKKVAKIVNVCSALLNICMHYNIPLDADLVEEDVSLRKASGEENEHPNYKRIAESIRDSIARSLQ